MMDKPLKDMTLEELKLSPFELELARRIGAKYVSRNMDSNNVFFWPDKPEDRSGVFFHRDDFDGVNILPAACMPSLASGVCVEVPYDDD